jgi:hypothetical protein
MKWQLYGQKCGKGTYGRNACGVYGKECDQMGWQNVARSVANGMAACGQECGKCYGSCGQERDKWEGSHVTMNVPTNGMAKRVENCMAVIVQESGVCQNRMAAFGQECGKWHGSTGSAKIKKLRVHMMSTIFSCVRLSLFLKRRTLLLSAVFVMDKRQNLLISNGCCKEILIISVLHQTVR